MFTDQACLGTGVWVWGLPKPSGLGTMIGFPQDRVESITHVGSMRLVAGF